jgi:hypothetical protein
MTVTSGRKWSALLTRSDPVSSLVRTFLGSSTWHSTIVLLTWKPSVTKRKRLYFRLVPSAPRIDATGSGLWPTPNVPNGGRSPKGGMSPTGMTPDGKKRQVGLEQMVKHVERGEWTEPSLIPTPRVEGFDAGRHRGKADSTHSYVKMFPTPRSSPNENRQTKPTPSQLAGKHGMNLSTAVHMLPTPTGQDAHNNGGPSQSERNTPPLNPDWVEALMGYPLGWTDIGKTPSPELQLMLLTVSTD